MNVNLIEGIKANKGKIIKRGLIIVGAAVGLLITYNVLIGSSDGGDFEFDDDNENDETTDTAEITEE